MLPAELEHVDRSEEVVLDQLTGACAAVNAREHTRIGGRIDQPVSVGQRLEVTGQSNVAMYNLHAQTPQSLPVDLAAGPHEVVYAVQLVPGPTLGPGMRQRRPNEPADAGDQNPHRRQGLTATTRNCLPKSRHRSGSFK